MPDFLLFARGLLDVAVDVLTQVCVCLHTNKVDLQHP